MICRTQFELDKAVEQKQKGDVSPIIIDATESIRVPIGAKIHAIKGYSHIYCMESAEVDMILGNTTILNISDCNIKKISDNAKIFRLNRSNVNCVEARATIDRVENKSIIEYMVEHAVIRVITDSTIKICTDDAYIMDAITTQIGLLSGNAILRRAYGVVVEIVRDYVKILQMQHTSKVHYVLDFAEITISSCCCTIQKLSGGAVVKIHINDFTKTQQDYGNIVKNYCGVKIIKTEEKDKSYTKEDFFAIFGEPDSDEIVLYKVVDENLMDYYTGTIKYEGIVVCPDWDSNPLIQCGHGLHLSPTIIDAILYRKGRLLKCKAKKDDIAVYHRDITKVRCKMVEVIEEVDYDYL